MKTNRTRGVPPRTWTAVRDFLFATFPACEHDPGGREAVRVAGKIFSYLAINERSRPPGIPANEEFIVVRIDHAERERLLESNPESFFVTPHYQSYPGVIVRLSTVDAAQLRAVLEKSWRLVAPKRLVRERDAGVR